MDNIKIKKAILIIISAMLLITVIINYVQFIQFMIMKNYKTSSAFITTKDNTYINIFIVITIMLIASLFILVTDLFDFKFKQIKIMKIVLLIVLLFLEILLIVFTIIYLNGYHENTSGYSIVKEGQMSAYLYISAILLPMVVSAGLLNGTLITSTIIDKPLKVKINESDD